MQNRYRTLVNILLFMAFIASTACDQRQDRALGRAELIISPESHAMTIGTDFRYQAKYVNSRGELEVQQDILWRIEDESIATIAQDGTVTGISFGQTAVFASVTTANAGETISNKALLTVVSDANAVAKVIITAVKTNLLVGENLNIAVEVRNLNDALLTNTNVLWFSSDESIALVDRSGNIQPLAAGRVDIFAQSDNIKSPVINFTIRQVNSVRSATFRGSKDYRAAGTATLKVLDSGLLEVEFSSDFSVSNGPRLEVFLAHGGVPDSTSVNLGALKANNGVQKYAVPNNVQIGDFAWIVIHCVEFNALFGNGQFQ